MNSQKDHSVTLAVIIVIIGLMACTAILLRPRRAGRSYHSSLPACEYFQVLKAAHKEPVWFEHSAHSPCFEEAEKFNRLIVKCILNKE